MPMTKTFSICDRVCLSTAPPYLKTADTMPMLRPPDLVQVGEIGMVMEQRIGGYWAVRFERGTFLVDSQYLVAADEPPTLPDRPESPLNPSPTVED